MNECDPQSVFQTYSAYFVAYIRAVESAREDRLFHDPFAETLAGNNMIHPSFQAWKWDAPDPQTSNLIALQTRFLDEAIDHRDHSIHQIVILGAGIDARSHRLESLRKTIVFELDQSEEILQYKEQVFRDANAVPKALQIHYIDTDLAEDSWDLLLYKNGFDKNVPTFWCMEGLLYFMNHGSLVKLVKIVDALSAPKSELWADMPGKIVVDKSIFTESLLKFFVYGEDDPLHGVLALTQYKLWIQADLSVATSYFGRDWVPLQYLDEKGASGCVPFYFIQGKKLGGDENLMLSASSR
uniref:Omethyltransferase putative n=1 Tax=Albugo laibachii Nc14 TaxID=890382 RepID=F0W9F7_9STRA|nr:Omethyltransferase putative [Albugo laibachii Nc14]|eukprot:CCA17771.1 Omethyltransferase putative [Albugo laibachii Nc14]